MNLYRTRQGTMIHTRDCRYAVNGKPWAWAESKSASEVTRVCVYFGYQTCLACKPLPGEVIRNLPKGFAI